MLASPSVMRSNLVISTPSVASTGAEVDMFLVNAAVLHDTGLNFLLVSPLVCTRTRKSINKLCGRN